MGKLITGLNGLKRRSRTKTFSPRSSPLASPDKENFLFPSSDNPFEIEKQDICHTIIMSVDKNRDLTLEHKHLLKPIEEGAEKAATSGKDFNWERYKHVYQTGVIALIENLKVRDQKEMQNQKDWFTRQPESKDPEFKEMIANTLCVEAQKAATSEDGNYNPEIASRKLNDGMKELFKILQSKRKQEIHERLQDQLDNAIKVNPSISMRIQELHEKADYMARSSGVFDEKVYEEAYVQEIKRMVKN